MKGEPDEYIASEIKVPVVSSLGIKAVIQISEIDHSFIPDESLSELFLRHEVDY